MRNSLYRVLGHESLLLMENGTSNLLHREQEQTTIRQMELLLIDALTQQQQAEVVVSV